MQKRNVRASCSVIALPFGLALTLLPVTSPGETVDVKVGDNFFQAPTVRIKVGDTVKWTWDNTRAPHTSTSGSCTNGVCTPGGSDSWNSPQTSAAGTTYTKAPAFTKAGTYPYFCAVHGASMTGTVIVEEAATPNPTPTPSPASCLPTDPVNLNPISAAIAKDPAPMAGLQDVAIGQGLVSPNWGTAAPGDKNHLYVSDTVGKLWAIDLRDGSKNLVLDVSALLVADLGKKIPRIPGYDERGFLGFAVHPEFRRNRLLYTFTTEPFVAGTADFPLTNLTAGSTPDNLSVVSEWKIDDPRAAQPKVSGDRRVLMRIEHPQFNHNGGALNFGPDGMLYIATGDGGSSNDQDAIGGHNPEKGNGQDLSSVLGKILRIDPLKRNSANAAYGIPRRNPFSTRRPQGGAQGCADGQCDEIWAYGFRNPYRFSFDMKRGRLLAADVGQNKLEEVDVVARGGNYGWNYKEGTFFFQPNGSNATGSGFVSDGNCRNVPTDGLIDPIAQYDHDEGIAIVGGFVYRGRAIRTLRGQYVFGDYARQFATSDPAKAGRIFHVDGKVRGRANPAVRTTVELRLKDDAALGLSVYGFAQDAKGEIYVLGNTLGVPVPRDTAGNLIETGAIKKLVPISP